MREQDRIDDQTMLIEWMAEFNGIPAEALSRGRSRLTTERVRPQRLRTSLIRHTRSVPGVRLTTIVVGYQRAWQRLQETYAKATAFERIGLDAQAAEEVWAAVFEALNWLDVLCVQPEVEARMNPDLGDALKFVRGRVHHALADAIELRRDVPVPLRPLAAGPGPRGPVMIADWCWLETAKLRGGKRPRNARARQRETAYENLLAGRQASAVLQEVASLAAEVVVGRWSRSGD